MTDPLRLHTIGRQARYIYATGQYDWIGIMLACFALCALFGAFAAIGIREAYVTKPACLRRTCPEGATIEWLDDRCLCTLPPR